MRLYDNATELEKTVQHAAHILSEITNLTSFALTPDINEDKLKFIQLLPLDEYTVVLMIVSESGKVSDTTLKLKEYYNEESLRILAKTL